MNIGVIAGFLNIAIGVGLTLATVYFLGGLLDYLFHLGSFHRVHALERMHFSVVMLVTIAVVIGMVRLLQWVFL